MSQLQYETKLSYFTENTNMTEFQYLIAYLIIFDCLSYGAIIFKNYALFAGGLGLLRAGVRDKNRETT